MNANIYQQLEFGHFKISKHDHKSQILVSISFLSI